MRDINFSIQQGAYTGIVRCPLEVIQLGGNLYAEVICDQLLSSAEDVTLSMTDGIIIEPITMPFTQKGDKSYARFDLSWFKYILEKNEFQSNLRLDFSLMGDAIAQPSFILTRNKKEIGMADYYIQPTQVIIVDYVFDEYGAVQVFRKRDAELLLGGESQGMDKGITELTLTSLSEGKEIEIVGHAKYTPKFVNCMPDNAMILRITSRYGTTGVIMGAAADKSKAGKEYLHKVNDTTYQGIYDVEAYGQQIIKEIDFDCDGEQGLVELLRDAQVYNVVEFYNFGSNTWQPCNCTGSKLNLQDPYAEQFLTIKLQQYD